MVRKRKIPVREAIKNHWPEYLMEAALLGLFMVSACTFGVLLDHPSAYLHQAIENNFLRRLLGGIAMGLTAMALIYSPWGKQSGAHMNPAVTLTFLRLGKVKPWDAVFYTLAQFAGGLGGVWLSHLAFGTLLAHPSVNFVATVPGTGGVSGALAGETAIAFVQMSMVLLVTSTPGLARYTGIFAGALVAAYITLEAPLSGMSMNPARTLGSAIPGNVFTALWIYFLAPPAAMLLAAQVRLAFRTRADAAPCAKMIHPPEKRCIFCGYKMGVRVSR